MSGLSAQPLNGRELDRIPVTGRTDHGGLTRAAKDNYRARRRLAHGGEESFVSRDVLAEAMGAVGSATVTRTTTELVTKGFLVETTRFRGKQRVYLLRKGRRVDRLVDRPESLSGRPESLPESLPESFVHRTRITGDPHIEEGEKDQRALRALADPSKEEGAAAEPAPPEGGSAAAKRAGWRFVRTESSGTFVRDPEGTDRLPNGYLTPPDQFGEREREADRQLVAEIAEEKPPPDEQRAAFVASMRQTVFQMFGGPPVGQRIGPGRCDDCGLVVAEREVFGCVRGSGGEPDRPRELCLDDLRRRSAAR